MQGIGKDAKRHGRQNRRDMSAYEDAAPGGSSGLVPAAKHHQGDLLEPQNVEYVPHVFD